MISYKKAKKILVKSNIKIKNVTINSLKSLNRVCAKDVYSPANYPAGNNTAFDGYAINSKDTSSLNNKKLKKFKIIKKNQVILNEDCITGMKKLKDNSVDIIICDPPYNIGKDFGNNSDKQDMDDYLNWCDEWISECVRILKSKEITSTISVQNHKYMR